MTLPVGAKIVIDLPEGEQAATVVKVRDGAKPYLLSFEEDGAPKWSSLARPHRVVPEERKAGQGVQGSSESESDSDDEAPEEVTNKAAPEPVIDAPVEVSSKAPVAAGTSVPEQDGAEKEVSTKPKKVKPAKTKVIPHSERLALLEEQKAAKQLKEIKKQQPKKWKHPKFGLKELVASEKPLREDFRAQKYLLMQLRRQKRRLQRAEEAIEAGIEPEIALEAAAEEEAEEEAAAGAAASDSAEKSSPSKLEVSAETSPSTSLGTTEQPCWRPEDDKLLLNFVGSGAVSEDVDFAMIAPRLNRTANACRKRVMRLRASPELLKKKRKARRTKLRGEMGRMRQVMAAESAARARAEMGLPPTVSSLKRQYKQRAELGLTKEEATEVARQLRQARKKKESGEEDDFGKLVEKAAAENPLKKKKVPQAQDEGELTTAEILKKKKAAAKAAEKGDDAPIKKTKKKLALKADKKTGKKAAKKSAKKVVKTA